MKDLITELPVIGIETSGELCGVSLFVSPGEIYTGEIRKKNIHSEKLLELVDQTLSSAGLSIQQVGSIAVSVGPGSFTGLRIGLSAAKGLAMGAELPIIPVPTFGAMALQIASHLPIGTKFIIANSVNITELYVAGYQKTGESFVERNPLSLLLKKDFDSYIEENDIIFGNFGTNEIKKISEPTSEFVCRYAYFYGKDLLTYNFDYLEPLYLKDFVAKESKK